MLFQRGCWRWWTTVLEMVLGATVVLVLARFAWLEEDKRGWGILKRPSKTKWA